MKKNDQRSSREKRYNSIVVVALVTLVTLVTMMDISLGRVGTTKDRVQFQPASGGETATIPLQPEFETLAPPTFEVLDDRDPMFNTATGTDTDTVLWPHDTDEGEANNEDASDDDDEEEEDYDDDDGDDEAAEEDPHVSTTNSDRVVRNPSNSQFNQRRSTSKEYFYDGGNGNGNENRNGNENENENDLKEVSDMEIDDDPFAFMDGVTDENLNRVGLDVDVNVDVDVEKRMHKKLFDRATSLSSRSPVSFSSAQAWSTASYPGMEGLSEEAIDDALEDPSLMEKVLERELYEMKPEDREAAIHELHGVEFESKNRHRELSLGWKEANKECPKKTARALNEMQMVLDELVPPASIISRNNNNTESSTNDTGNERGNGNPNTNHRGYRRGLELKSDYICTPEYRLKFLRADRFDAQKAAVRYCACLDLLMKCFGENIFRRQLYMSDLTSLEHKFFRDGNIQVLPSRDRIGRRVIVFISRHDASTPEEYFAAFRLIVYITWAVLAEDVTTQIKGAVVLIFPSFEESSLAKQSAKKLNQLITTLPLRFSAIHFCIPDVPIFNMVRSLCLVLIGAEGRRVCRVHTGSPVEVDYALSSYGINVKDIPRTYTFMIKTKNWARFAKVRTAIDNYRKKTESETESEEDSSVSGEICGVECPEVNCILFGNKAMAWDHPGNIEFRDLIEEKELEREMYPKNALKGDKYNDCIIDAGRSRKFVYMEYDKVNLWYTEITDENVLRHKITQLLTGIRKRRKGARMAQKMRMDISTVENTPLRPTFDGASYIGNRCDFLCNFS